MYDIGIILWYDNAASCCGVAAWCRALGDELLQSRLPEVGVPGGLLIPPAWLVVQAASGWFSLPYIYNNIHKYVRVILVQSIMDIIL